MPERCGELERFVRGELDPKVLSHEQHVQMGFELLRRQDFTEAAHLFSVAVRTMANRAGNPGAFHQTITIAFLSLIAERMQTSRTDNRCGSFAAFGAANPDLFVKSVLSRWYSSARLAADIARRTFVLPDQRP
jgi:hypothetical protein